MIHKIDLIEETRAKRLKIFKTVSLVALGILVVSVILFLIKQFALKENDTLFAVAVFFLIIAIATFIIGTASSNAGYDKFVKEHLENEIMKDVYSGNEFSYAARAGISFQEMNISGIFKNPDEFSTSDTIRTAYKGVNLVVSDYIFTRIVVTTDSKGNTTTHHYPYPGRYMSFSIKRNFMANVSIIDKRNNGDVFYLKPYREKPEFESMEFEKKFYTTATDKEKVFLVIRPKEIMDFIDLSKTYQGKIVNVLYGHTIYLILADTKIEFSFSIFRKIDQGLIRDIYAYYELPLRIIDKLKLDGDRYNAKELGWN